MNAQRPLRVACMMVGMIALLTGLWAGLLRLGWPWPALRPTLPGHHGPLMVSGFLGTLIGLERAVELGSRWTYVTPLATALGVLVFLTGGPESVGPLCMTVGSLGFVASNSAIISRQPTLVTMTMGLGGLAWLVGNSLWLIGWPIYQVVWWWAGFLVLTIAGELLELSREVRLAHGTEAAFLGVTGVFVCGLVVTTIALDIGVRVMGVGMLSLALWLLHHDLVHHTISREGQPRFIAICLLSGALWLAVSGALGLLAGGVMVGPSYDAVLHALFLGFVVSMLFGHAPLILPSILNRPVPFQRRFHIHLALLHLSLLLRLVGDLALWWPGRQWGGLLNVVAFLVFLVNTGYAIRTNTSLT
jgi:hypothetical protein